MNPAASPREGRRQQAIEHARQIEAVLWLGVPELKARWGVGGGTVRMIDRAKLPYLEMGKSKIRRYDPRDVEAYEAAEKLGKVA